MGKITASGSLWIEVRRCHSNRKLNDLLSTYTNSIPLLSKSSLFYLRCVVDAHKHSQLSQMMHATTREASNLCKELQTGVLDVHNVALATLLLELASELSSVGIEKEAVVLKQQAIRFVESFSACSSAISPPGGLSLPSFQLTKLWPSSRPLQRFPYKTLASDDIVDSKQTFTELDSSAGLHLAQSLYQLSYQLRIEGEKKGEFDVTVKAIGLFRELGPRYPDTAIELAYLLTGMSAHLREAEARCALEEAVAILKGIETGYPNGIRFCNVLAPALHNLSLHMKDEVDLETNDQIATSEKCVETYKNILSSNPELFGLYLIIALYQLGLCFWRAGRQRDALSVNREARDYAVKLLIPLDDLGPVTPRTPAQPRTAVSPVVLLPPTLRSSSGMPPASPVMLTSPTLVSPGTSSPPTPRIFASPSPLTQLMFASPTSTSLIAPASPNFMHPVYGPHGYIQLPIPRTPTGWPMAIGPRPPIAMADLARPSAFVRHGPSFMQVPLREYEEYEGREYVCFHCGAVYELRRYELHQQDTAERLHICANHD